MPLRAHLLLAVTALCCCETVFGIPLVGFNMDHNCRCLQTTDSFISTSYFKKMEIVPAGTQCANIEIIITLRNNKSVCVDPEAQWVQDLILRMTKRMKATLRK